MKIQLARSTFLGLQYFGGKRQLAPSYPPPQRGKIIEPFCGGAAYSWLYWDRDVRINDVNERLIAVYRYLQAASPQDILALPRLQTGQAISEILYLSDAERDLLRLFCHFGSGGATWRDKVSPQGAQDVKAFRLPLARNLHKMRHWTITSGSYLDLPNDDATWFVDPPYIVAGKMYEHHRIDYPQLAAWCRSRRGQVIVCENQGATWLPFRPFRVVHNGVMKPNKEVLWHRPAREPVHA